MSRPARPVPSAQTRPFWEGLAAHVLRLPWCGCCDAFRHPRSLRCRQCWGDLAWRDVSGQATADSWTVVHRPFAAGFTPPYIVGQVRPVEQPDVLIDTTLLASPDELSVGRTLQVVFIDDERGFTRHAFRPAG